MYERNRKVMKKIVGAGGTPGGIMEFFMGSAMTLVGGYLVLNQIHVTSHFFLGWFGSNQNAFGAVFSLFLLGVCFVFFNSRSYLGWGMMLLGLFATGYGVIANLQIYFQSTNAISTFVMFGLVAAGIGLMLKGLAAHDLPQG